MNERIRKIKQHIANLENLLEGSVGKTRARLNEEIFNAHFELNQLYLQCPAAIVPVVNIILLSLKLLIAPGVYIRTSTPR